LVLIFLIIDENERDKNEKIRVKINSPDQGILVLDKFNEIIEIYKDSIKDERSSEYIDLAKSLYVCLNLLSANEITESDLDVFILNSKNIGTIFYNLFSNTTGYEEEDDIIGLEVISNENPEIITKKGRISKPNSKYIDYRIIKDSVKKIQIKKGISLPIYIHQIVCHGYNLLIHYNLCYGIFCKNEHTEKMISQLKKQYHNQTNFHEEEWAFQLLNLQKRKLFFLEDSNKTKSKNKIVLVDLN
jgi:hypothetical protein